MNSEKSLKNKIHEIKKQITHPERIVFDICNYDHYQYAKLFSDKTYIKCFYKKYMRKKLNLKNPKTFNEKLQWLKLNDRRPEYSIMADKSAMKEYISQKIGSGYTVPTIGIYDSFDDIEFEKLPKRFVLKCNHDSGGVFICKDKKTFDFDNARKELSENLKRNFYWAGREWPYKNITPKIIAEEFLCDDNGDYPLDYKLFCFNGKMQFFKIDFNRFTAHRANYYNRNLELQSFGEYWLQPDPTIVPDFPADFGRMIEIADKLSEGIPFLRVDFYYVKGQIYIGELTFYPAGGAGILTENGDEIMGEMLDISSVR